MSGAFSWANYLAAMIMVATKIDEPDTLTISLLRVA